MSFSPLNSSRTVNCLPATEPMKTPASAFATIQVSPSTLHLTYSMSGCTMMPRLNGMVHGVVVQTMKYSSSLPAAFIFTKMDGSDTILYSSSCFASAVWCAQSQAMERMPS